MSNSMAQNLVNTFKITSKTSEYGLRVYGVDVLRATIDAHGISRAKGLKKPELIALIMGHVAELQLKEAGQKLVEEKKKAERIEWEKELPNAAGACKLIAEAFEKELAAAKASHDKFRERAASDPADAIKWMCENAFYASAAIYQFTGWAALFNKQAVEPTRTITEVQQLLEEAAERSTNDALSSSMYPTNALQALEYTAKFQVNRKLAKMFKCAAKYYRAAAESVDDKELLNLGYISYC